MAAVLQAIALISEPPGAFLYQVILLCVLALIAARSAAVGAKRVALAFGGLAGLRAVALMIGLLTSRLPLYQLVIMPPFDRAVACLTIFGLIWAFTYPQSRWLAYGVAGAAVLLISAAAVASWVVWVDAVGAGSLFYNGSLLDTLWLTAQLFILAAGMVVLLSQRPGGWQAGLALLVILFVGEGLHYLFPIADANVPGFVRLAELIVWPVAAVVLWRRPPPVPAREKAKGTAAPNAAPAIQNMSVELLHGELEAANRRNQQLRETNRQTRQQLAAATATLAKLAQARDSNQAAVAAGEPTGSDAAELAREQSARAQVEAAAQALEQRVASLEAMIQAAGDQSSAAILAAEELQAVRQMAQSQAQLVANLGLQLADAQAQQQEEAAARQAVEARLGQAQAGEQTITAQVAQHLQAESALRAELRDTKSALAEARRTSDRAQAQLAEQASQLGALQQQVAQLERLASQRNGQVERRHPAPPTGLNEDMPGSNAPRRPKNGNTGREESAAAASGNGNGAAGHAAIPGRAGMLGADLKPELTPTIAGPVCPHLGLHADHATRHAFPSDANRCLGLAAPTEVTLEQQRRYCLGGAHVGCPIFTRQLLNPVVPIDTSTALPPEPKSSKGLGWRIGRMFRRQS
jgi:hypothetical protein